MPIKVAILQGKIINALNNDLHGQYFNWDWPHVVQYVLQKLKQMHAYITARVWHMTPLCGKVHPPLKVAQESTG